MGINIKDMFEKVTNLYKGKVNEKEEEALLENTKFNDWWEAKMMIGLADKALLSADEQKQNNALLDLIEEDVLFKQINSYQKTKSIFYLSARTTWLGAAVILMILGITLIWSLWVAPGNPNPTKARITKPDNKFSAGTVENSPLPNKQFAEESLNKKKQPVTSVKKYTQANVKTKSKKLPQKKQVIPSPDKKKAEQFLAMAMDEVKFLEKEISGTNSFRSTHTISEVKIVKSKNNLSYQLSLPGALEDKFTISVLDSTNVLKEEEFPMTFKQGKWSYLFKPQKSSVFYYKLMNDDGLLKVGKFR